MDNLSPMDGELNPEHPVLEALREHWPKLCMAMMLKFSVTDVDLGPDVLSLINGWAMTVRMPHDTIHLQIVRMEDGKKLADDERRGGHGAPRG